MRNVAAFLSGLVFAIGLFVGGMTQPENIIGFLDVFGAWKPALAFVMAGALGLYAAVYPFVRKRPHPLFSKTFDVPDTTKKVDAKLLVGAATFGIGWGLAGFCPGPVLVVLGTGSKEAVLFFLAMIFGVVLYRFATQTGPSKKDDPNTCG